MVHRIESRPVKVDFYLPLVPLPPQSCFLRQFLVIPHDVYLLDEISITLLLGVPVEVLLEDRIISLSRMRYCEKTKTQ